MSRVATSLELVPEPCRILGTALRPFCLGHHLLFNRLNLPFAENALADCSKDDVMIAAAICAAPSYEISLDLMLNGGWQEFVSDWIKKVRGPIWRRRKVDWHDTLLLFRAYIQDGYKRPPVYRRDGGLSLSSPWEELLKCKLIMAGFSETEVLNGYLPARWYDYFTVSEINQLEKCKEIKDFRKIFFTQEDAELMKGVDEQA